jgi:hypothetical protein
VTNRCDPGLYLAYPESRTPTAAARHDDAMRPVQTFGRSKKEPSAGRLKRSGHLRSDALKAVSQDADKRS